MAFELPQDARINSDFDVIALTAGDSYWCQIVRLTLEEKGIRWINKEISLLKSMNLEPWYL